MSQVQLAGALPTGEAEDVEGFDIPARARRAHWLFDEIADGAGQCGVIDERLYFDPATKVGGRGIHILVTPEDKLSVAVREAARQIAKRLGEADAGSAEGEFLEWRDGAVTVRLALEGGRLRFECFFPTGNGSALEEAVAACPLDILREARDEFGPVYSMSCSRSVGEPPFWCVQGGPAKEGHKGLEAALRDLGFAWMASGRAVRQGALGVQFRDGGGWVILRPAPTFL